MDAASATPGRPGWYWDPWELEHNTAIRDKWRRQIILRELDPYRLRRWDGLTWTGDTLREDTMNRLTNVPHLIGPTTRIYPLTPARAARNLKIWAGLMVVCTLVFLVSLLMG